MSECVKCGVTTGDLPYEEMGLDIEAADELLFERVDGQDMCQGCAGEVIVNDENDLIAWGTELTCVGCDDEITPRYAMYGVCKNCFGTTDDPFLAERGLDL